MGEKKQCCIQGGLGNSVDVRQPRQQTRLFDVKMKTPPEREREEEKKEGRRDGKDGWM